MLENDRKRGLDHHILHATLQSPKEFSFATLFSSGDDQALIMLTGFDHATFQELHNLFAPVFNAFNLLSQGADGSYLEVIPDKSLVAVLGLLIALQGWQLCCHGLVFKVLLRYNQLCLDVLALS
jgi:hypothetical protein